MSLAITPQTRVGAVLDAYPELLATLLALSPSFEKLKNPVLRRTVAKVATLQAAAAMAEIDAVTLVDALRREVGQPPLQDVAAGPAGEATAPDWISDVRVAHTVFADELLADGAHPLARVQSLRATLSPGEAVRIVSGFRPEPLLEALAAGGWRVHTAPVGRGRWETLATFADPAG